MANQSRGEAGLHVQRLRLRSTISCTWVHLHLPLNLFLLHTAPSQSMPIYVNSKTSLNLPTLGTNISGYICSVWQIGISLRWTFWDPCKGIDIGEWSMCGGGRLEKFYCICLYIYLCISITSITFSVYANVHI